MSCPSVQGLCSVPVQLQQLLEPRASSDASSVSRHMRPRLQNLGLELLHLPQVRRMHHIRKRELIAGEELHPLLGAQMGFVDIQHLAELCRAPRDELLIHGTAHGSRDVDLLHHGCQRRVQVMRFGFHPLVDCRSLFQRLAQEGAVLAVVLLSYVSGYGSRLWK